MSVGIVVGAIIGPGVALAAFSDIRIVGQGGTPAAQVTAANQLQTTEASPSRIRTWSFVVSLSRGCSDVSVPSDSSLMLTQVIVDGAGPPNTAGRVAFFATKTCSGPEIATVSPPQGVFGTTVIPFEPGVPIASGGGFSVNATQGVFARVFALGYTMPSDAVPKPRAPIKIPG